MARTLDQIVAELNPTYQAQVDSINQRKAEIPGQIEAEEKGLQAKQETAFGDILNGARRRGLGFSGIPLAEQAKYTSTEFLPALARLRQTGRDQERSLQDAILGIYERRDTLANQMRQQEIDRDWQREQFERQLAESRRQAAAAAGSGFSPTLGSFGGGGGGANNGSAQKFVGNDDLRGRLLWTARNGSNAKQKEMAALALKYVGNDGKYNLAWNTLNAPIMQQLNAMGFINAAKQPAASSKSTSSYNGIPMGNNFAGRLF